VVSLTSSSGGYINGRNSANLELLIDNTSSIYLYVKYGTQNVKTHNRTMQKSEKMSNTDPTKKPYMNSGTLKGKVL
jgi:hypothetical protein